MNLTLSIYIYLCNYILYDKILHYLSEIYHILSLSSWNCGAEDRSSVVIKYYEHMLHCSSPPPKNASVSHTGLLWWRWWFVSPLHGLLLWLRIKEEQPRFIHCHNPVKKTLSCLLPSLQETPWSLDSLFLFIGWQEAGNPPCTNTMHFKHICDNSVYCSIWKVQWCTDLSQIYSSIFVNLHSTVLLSMTSIGRSDLWSSPTLSCPAENHRYHL